MTAPEKRAAPSSICEVRIICKNLNGRTICDIPLSLSAGDQHTPPLSRVSFAAQDQRTPHGEVQKMLGAKGAECVKDCLAEAAKRVGSDEVVRYKHSSDLHSLYYQGLGDHCCLPDEALRGFEEISRDRSGYRLDRRGLYRSAPTTGWGGADQIVCLFKEKTVVSDLVEHFVSAELVIRDMRVCLVFVLNESRLPGDTNDGVMFRLRPGRGYAMGALVAIEPDRNGRPKGCLPLREGDSVSGEIYGLKLDTSLLHDPNSEGHLMVPVGPTGIPLPNPWLFPFRDKARAAVAWSTIERACSLLHEIDSDPTRLLGDFPQYQKITPGMILSAAFAPSRITFILDSDEACAGGAGGAALGPADTFSSLRKIVESPDYRELHEVKEETVLEYHVYVMVDASRQQGESVPRGDQWVLVGDDGDGS